MHGGTGRKRGIILLGGAMYALMASFGWQAEHLEASRPGRALLVAAALLVPAMAALALLLRQSGRNVQAARERGSFSAGKAFLAILACYVPMFLVLFPGSFAYDVPFQLEQVFTGQYSTHHPLLHTLLLGGCVKLGHAMGSINLGAALYSALQMTALAACFAAACASIARQSGARAARRSAVFFAAYPLHMMMAVNATKDVLFSGLFVLTLALVREAVTAERMDGWLAAGVVWAGAGMMLLRNNALYAVAVWLVLLMMMYRRRAVKAAGAALLALALCVAANGALKAATNAGEGDLCEMLSWPIQQLARARNLHGDRLTDGERAAIDELMPGESWALYDPTISDPVKFEFDTQALLSDVGKYVRVYVSVGAKCPQAYLDAVLHHTYSFWYPYSAYGVSGYYLQMGISDQYYEWCDFERISDQSLAPRVRASLTWRFGAQGAMQIPAVGYLFNMGVIVWVMLYFVLREMYLGRWRSFACAMLPVLLLGTFLLGPVMAGRYIYPFVCSLPVLASHARSVPETEENEDEKQG
ncbi:MAG: DUF6020 family protein [Candidatus Ventricola sp.]